MPRLLISVLLVALVAGCSSMKLGPHRIDVQQGNALDQENVSRLKPGLNRSQVRFLLGTPLVVDPFRADRWDYVYVYYKAGKLAEQKRITLFFEGDTLARIEGDVPKEVAEAQAQPPATARADETSRVAPSAPDAQALAAEPALQEPTPAAQPAAEAAPAAAPASVAAPASGPAPGSAPAAEAAPASAEATSETSVVAPLSSPKNATPDVDPPAAAEGGPRGEADVGSPAAAGGGLRSDTDIAKVQPDVTPPFPGSEQAAGADAALLKALADWADAWSRRDAEAYFAAYDARFVPEDGTSHEAWRRRKLQAFNATKTLEVKVDAPVVEHTEEGAVALTFKQFFRSDTYRDAVTKQLLMVEREGRWLIVEEKVLTKLGGAKP